MRKHVIGVLVLLLVAGAATAAEPADPALRDLHERWAKALRTLRVPGLAVVVVRGDEVIHLETLGLRNPDGAKPVTADTYRARYSDPVAGRWPNEDPSSFGAQDPNLYRYAKCSSYFLTGPQCSCYRYLESLRPMCTLYAVFSRAGLSHIWWPDR